MLDTDADIRVLPTIFQELRKYEELQTIESRLDIFESTYHAMLGLTPGKGQENQRNARRWARALERRRDKLLGIKSRTIYDRKSRKL